MQRKGKTFYFSFSLKILNSISFISSSKKNYLKTETHKEKLMELKPKVGNKLRREFSYFLKEFLPLAQMYKF